MTSATDRITELTREIETLPLETTEYDHTTESTSRYEIVFNSVQSTSAFTSRYETTDDDRLETTFGESTTEFSLATSVGITVDETTEATTSIIIPLSEIGNVRSNVITSIDQNIKTVVKRYSFILLNLKLSCSALVFCFYDFSQKV